MKAGDWVWVRDKARPNYEKWSQASFVRKVDEPPGFLVEFYDLEKKQLLRVVGTFPECKKELSKDDEKGREYA